MLSEVMSVVIQVMFCPRIPQTLGVLRFEYSKQLSGRTEILNLEQLFRNAFVI